MMDAKFEEAQAFAANIGVLACAMCYTMLCPQLWKCAVITYAVDDLFVVLGNVLLFA